MKQAKISKEVLEELTDSLEKIEKYKITLGDLDIRIIQNERERTKLDKKRSEVVSIINSKMDIVESIRENITEEHGPVTIDVNNGNIIPLNSTQ